MSFFAEAIQRGDRASQPAAGDVVIGTLYYVTDEEVTERSDGATWEDCTDGASLGLGDVVGPAASIEKEIALFDGTTGKLLERATGTGFVKVTSGVYQAPAATIGTAEITDANVTFAKIQNADACSVVGRSANSSGVVDEIAAAANGLTLQRRADAVGFSNLGVPLIVRKTTGEDVTSSDVLIDDAELFFPIAASEIWIYEFVLFIVGNTTGKFKVAIQAPAASVVQHGVDGIDDAETVTSGPILRQVSASLSPTGFAIANNTTATMVKFTGICVNGVNAGNIQLRWAQSVSNGTATTVQANSYCLAHRVA